MASPFRDDSYQSSQETGEVGLMTDTIYADGET